jgi:DNA topoisomerase III
VAREQMSKLLETGKTDLLDKFVSMRTRRAFKAFLAWDKEAGKVNFEFEPRESKFPPRKTAGSARTGRQGRPREKGRRQEGAGRQENRRQAQSPAQDHRRHRQAAQRRAGRRDRRRPVSRPEVVKKLWDYIKANGLQDAADKRKHQRRRQAAPGVRQAAGHHVRIAGIVGKHLS